MYYRYLDSNPVSLITKIYGVYLFEGFYNELICMILM